MYADLFCISTRIVSKAWTCNLLPTWKQLYPLLQGSSSRIVSITIFHIVFERLKLKFNIEMIKEGFCALGGKRGLAYCIFRHDDKRLNCCLITILRLFLLVTFCFSRDEPQELWSRWIFLVILVWEELQLVVFFVLFRTFKV